MREITFVLVMRQQDRKTRALGEDIRGGPAPTGRRLGDRHKAVEKGGEHAGVGPRWDRDDRGPEICPSRSLAVYLAVGGVAARWCVIGGTEPRHRVGRRRRREETVVAV